MPSDVITAEPALTGPYRSVNYRDEIVHGACGLVGIDVIDGDLGRDQARNIATSVNSYLRKGWDYYPFEELRIVEERAFRQVYAPELYYSAGTQVYDIETHAYWEVIASGGAAAGESPTDAPDKWKRLYCIERFIARDQYLKQRIGQVLSVTAFNPRLGRSNGWVPPRHRLPFHLSEMGIEVDTELDTVWIRYLPEQPVFTSEEYDPAKEYNAGALVYSPGEPGDPQTGDCFRAREATKGDALSELTRWSEQSFPYILAEYVKFNVAADLSEDRGSRADFQAEAERRIQQAIDFEMNQQSPRLRRPYYFGGLPVVAITA